MMVKPVDIRIRVSAEQAEQIERIRKARHLETMSQTWRYCLRIAARQILQDEPQGQGEAVNE